MKGDAAAPLRRMLTALPAAANAAVAAAGEETLRAARSLVPVRSGRLRASLTLREDGVYTRCPYAGPVEFSTPYLAPAVHAQSFEQRMRAALKEVFS